MNTFTFAGNAVGAPELRKTDNGHVATLRIGLPTPKNADGTDRLGADGKPIAEFRDISVWNQLAENAAASIDKGTFVRVSGFTRVVKLKDIFDADGKEINRYSNEFSATSIGIDISFATAEVTKNERKSGSSNSSKSKGSKSKGKEKASKSDKGGKAKEKSGKKAKSKSTDDDNDF